MKFHKDYEQFLAANMFILAQADKNFLQARVCSYFLQALADKSTEGALAGKFVN